MVDEALASGINERTPEELLEQVMSRAIGICSTSSATSIEAPVVVCENSTWRVAVTTISSPLAPALAMVIAYAFAVPT